MPQVKLDYSSNLLEANSDFNSLFKELHDNLVNSGEFDSLKVKCFAQCHQNYYVGDGRSENAFIALQISLLAGRSIDLRSSICKDSLSLLKVFFRQSLSTLKCRLTVEVREIDPSTHFGLESD